MRSVRLSLLVAAAALAGCSSLKVETEYDPAAPFPSYRTYAWITAAPGPEQAAPMRDPRVVETVVAAFDREMTRKGLVRTTPQSSPDLLVTVIGWSRTRIDVTNYGYSYGTGYAYAPYGPVAMPVPYTDVREYREGTLLIDFVDAKSMKMVWRGSASDAVTSPESVRKSIDAAASELLDAYPPRK